jgi:cytochrome c-type biogenesis protein CcmH
MTLGLILMAMTAAALFAVIWPLTRRAEATHSGHDIEVYRDQLDEVERDLTAGLIAKNEAEAARIEISRRLLAAADAAQTAQPHLDGATATWHRRAAAFIALLLFPVLAGGLYLWLGSPRLASAQPQPADSAVTASQSVDELVAEAEAHLQRNPEEGPGWEILAPVYMRLGRYSDSVTAWRNALRLLGESAERDANLGESLTAEANGVVTADASAAFVRALTIDKTLVGARYYLGLAAEQDGDRDKAAKLWHDLIADAPADAEWVAHVRDALARVEGNSISPPGPSAAHIAAAANQPPEQQSAMIRSMVERLAARLKQDGSDVDGWVRLVRSYKVLDESENARTAVADAHRALAGDLGKLKQLDLGLKDLDADATVPEPEHDLAAQTTAGAPQHGATIQDMVGRLVERLKISGSDPQGWLTLVRSYKALGEKDKASAAVSSARQALADDPDKLEQFNKALANFNVNE